MDEILKRLDEHDKAINNNQHAITMSEQGTTQLVQSFSQDFVYLKQHVDMLIVQQKITNAVLVALTVGLFVLAAVFNG